MKDYFRLQWLMTNRKISEVGIPPLLGYGLGIVAFVLFAFFLFYKTEFAPYILLLGCVSWQLNLTESSRTDFLLSTFGDKAKNKIRIVENLLICVPFLAMLLYKGLLVEAAILLLISILSAPFAMRSSGSMALPSPFSKRPFEFLIGWRNAFLFYPLSIMLTVIAIQVDNLNLGIFAMLLIFLISLSVYLMPEQEYYVWIYDHTASSFLIHKIIEASKNVTLLVAPIGLCLSFFYPSNVQWIVVAYLVALLFLWAMILAKYSAYPREMNLPEAIILMFSLFFPPMLLFAIPYFYIKSIKHLKFLLND